MKQYVYYCAQSNQIRIFDACESCKKQCKVIYTEDYRLSSKTDTREWILLGKL